MFLSNKHQLIQWAKVSASSYFHKVTEQGAQRCQLILQEGGQTQTDRQTDKLHMSPDELSVSLV